MNYIDNIVNNNFDFLHSADFDINYTIKSEDNDSVFMYAMYASSLDYCKALLDFSPNLLFQNDLKENIIHNIVLGNNVEKLCWILKTKPEIRPLMDSKNIDEETPLMAAIQLGFYEMAIALIDFGADVTIPMKDNITPIHAACFEGDFHLVKKILDSGANVFVKADDGSYPLSWAVNNNHKQIVRYIVDRYY